jgi:hypothetical protein
VRFLSLALVAVPLLAIVAPAAGAVAFRFGMDASALDGLADLGAPADYAQLWAGVWNERSGWDGLGRSAADAAHAGAVPVIEWWYWGDDISPSCVRDGCASGLHESWKSQALWAADGAALADALHDALRGREAIVVVESEFNKNGVSSWEDFDGMLAQHAAIFQARAPEVRLALGFGNWGRDAWPRFDRAVAAMDMVAFQTMRGSTRDSAASYAGAAEATLDAALALQEDFAKPILLHDLALSSYPEASYAAEQRDALAAFFARLPELKAAGVEGVLYRSLRDTDMDPANYYGLAERGWGLQHRDGTAKPALDVWLAGVEAERAAGRHATRATAADMTAGVTWAEVEDAFTDLWNAASPNAAAAWL